MSERELTEWERQRNARILSALRAQRKRHEANPEEAREFLMQLGYWNEDGSLKEEFK